MVYPDTVPGMLGVRWDYTLDGIPVYYSLFLSIDSRFLAVNCQVTLSIIITTIIIMMLLLQTAHNAIDLPLF